MLLAHALGKADGSHRFQQREQRSAKEPCLLTGDDRDRTRIAKARRSGERLGRCAAPLLLGSEQIGHRFPLPLVLLSAADGVAPGCRIGRVAGVELGKTIEGKGVVGRQPVNPGETTDVDEQSG
jgi:hypothetical protein